MSGTEGPEESLQVALEERIFAVLDRQTPIDALGSLVFALHPSPRGARLEDTAIALDANVFLRLGSNSKAEDIIDYLRSAHGAPFIVPGQVIQEFWNNQFRAVESIAASTSKNFTALSGELAKLDGTFGEFSDRFRTLLDEFSSNFGYVYDEGTVRRTHQLLDVIQSKAAVPFASRMRFAPMAIQRKRTKTPPGFKDDGDGDFYVWIDLLLGLLAAKEQGSSFSRAVLVSEEKKPDWNREGTPHPILISEIKALIEVDFEIWPLRRLIDEIAKA